MSSWFTSIANDWRHEGEEQGQGGKDKGAGRGGGADKQAPSAGSKGAEQADTRNHHNSKAEPAQETEMGPEPGKAPGTEQHTDVVEPAHDAKTSQSSNDQGSGDTKDRVANNVETLLS